jgi:hypothetical protein
MNHARPVSRKMRAKKELEIPILVLDPVRVLGRVLGGVEVDIDFSTMDHESLIRAKRMLKEEYNLERVRRITLCKLGRTLKIE